ncbi:MAG TPA: hypothetical protein PKA82_16975 [Pyrinomonadaceae bacterium]|nr:hypothetical protein [Pyrinomonadaceae bacterium]
MIRRNEQIFSTFAMWAGRAGRHMLTTGAMCLCLDNSNYQPKSNGEDRSQQLD